MEHKDVEIIRVKLNPEGIVSTPIDEKLITLILSPGKSAIDPILDKMLRDPKNVKGAHQHFNHEPSEEELLQYLYLYGDKGRREELMDHLKKVLPSSVRFYG